MSKEIVNKKQVDILEFSKSLILYCSTISDEITNLKLQKLLYYVHSWVLAQFGFDIFNEQPEAWINGPVYPSVYREYSKYSFNAIDIDDLKINDSDNYFYSNNLDREILTWIKQVIGVYIELSASKLVLLSHMEEPWKEARQGLSDFEKSNNKISLETMKNFYAKRLKTNA